MSLNDPTVQRVTFPGSFGSEIAARLDMPNGQVRDYALFAHCFTCSKDVLAAKRIAAELAARNIAVLRFDFTGLGSSEGEFANTDFSSNVGDLLRAVDFLRENYQAPRIMIGHSLGGAAVLAAASQVPEVKAIATIGAPADADHVIHNFGDNVEQIRADGQAEVSLAGRNFTIRREFIEDLEAQAVRDRVSKLGKALLIFHSPIDETVGIENAEAIYKAAKHPKSFVTLDRADHLLTRPEDARYVAKVLVAWADRYLDTVDEPTDGELPAEVRAVETRAGKFQTRILAGAHQLIADEPKSYGGFDSGPSPYDLLSSALAACTTMTLRMYADRKAIPLHRVSVDINHAKVHAKDCEGCDPDLVQASGKIDVFERVISLDGELTSEQRQKLLEIADKCPVHRTLESGAHVATKLSDD